MRTATHEDFSREDALTGSSDRGFGFVFAGAFAVFALLPWIRGGRIRLWAAGVSVIFLVLALVAPKILAPLNRLWIRLAVLLSKITNPIITGALFFLVFTPMGVLIRAMGKDLLRLRRDPDAKSYWIPREPPGPAPESIVNQF